MRRYRPLYVSVPVHTVTLEPGETLTVYLGRRRQDSDPPHSQVELRVTLDGVRELFTDEDDARLQRRDFSAWTRDGAQPEEPSE